MRLPHNAGKIGNSEWSKSNTTVPDQDVDSGVVVGQDNFTGEAIASNGSINVRGKSTDDPELGKEVGITRPNSTQKARKTVFKFATFRTITTRGRKRFTNSGGNAKNVKACGSNFAGGGGSNYSFPDPPLEPPDDPPEDEQPIEIPVEDPTAPIVCKDPAPPIVRAKVQSDKYYPADSIDDLCPLGMTKAGYVDFGGGEIYIQCKGESFDAGVAVPADPTTYGWDCSPCGTCIKTKGGKYPTLAICQSSGCKPVTYTCTATGCVPVYDGSGEFKSLSECQTSCSAVPYSCIDGECIQTLDGKFATLEECLASGCTEPPSTTTRIEIIVRVSDLYCGVIEKTNVTYLGYFNTFDYATERWRDTGLSSGSCDTPFTLGSATGVNGIWVAHFNSDQGQFYIFIALNDTFPVQAVTITPL